METPKNPLRHMMETSKNRIYALAFIMGAFPFLIVAGLQIAQYATIILIVCVVLGAILRLVLMAKRRY